MQHLPSDENVKPVTAIDNWGMDKLNVEYRREANRERDGYYMSRERFAAWMKAMGEKYENQ